MSEQTFICALTGKLTIVKSHQETFILFYFAVLKWKDLEMEFGKGCYEVFGTTKLSLHNVALRKAVWYIVTICFDIKSMQILRQKKSKWNFSPQKNLKTFCVSSSNSFRRRKHTFFLVYNSSFTLFHQQQIRWNIFHYKIIHAYLDSSDFNTVPLIPSNTHTQVQSQFSIKSHKNIILQTFISRYPHNCV